DGPTVAEDGQAVTVDVGPDQEAVLLDGAERTEADGHLLEVEREPVAASDLHRVAAAESRGVRSERPLEVGEVPFRAARTVRRAGRQIDEVQPPLPDVEDRHLPGDALRPAREDLERLGGLQRSDQA